MTTVTNTPIVELDLQLPTGVITDLHKVAEQLSIGGNTEISPGQLAAILIEQGLAMAG
jgi:hypothetical protein